MYDYWHFRCNICGSGAAFVVQLELVKENSRKYDVLHSQQQMPFYLCKSHEYIYKRCKKT
jgi:hypothetical protein